MLMYVRPFMCVYACHCCLLVCTLDWHVCIHL